MDYIKKNVAGFQAINVVPANQIKCSKCHKYFPIDLIDGHVAIHIKPKFLLPSSKNNNLKKLNVLKGLKQQLKAQADDIDILTMMPEEFPTQQKQRRNIYVPKGTAQPSKKDILDLQLNSLKVKVDDHDITSIIGGKLNYEFLHSNELIKLEEDYEIPLQKTKLTKRTINLYQNRKVQIRLQNQKVELKKRLVSEKKNEEAYQILSNKDSSITANTQRKTKRIQCGFVKSTIGVSNSFLTVSKISSKMKDKQDNQFFQDAVTLLSKKDSGKCNCKCSCCGGFYCKACNSAIPPQFRPAHPTQSQEIKYFWQQHYQQNKKCQNCEN